MPAVPPPGLVSFLIDRVHALLTANPLATENEAYLKHCIEFELLAQPVVPPYFLRIGINYHGAKVQHIGRDPATGQLIGWNPQGDALATGKKAKVLLAGKTIVDRLLGEQMMSDTKIGGGPVPHNTFIRCEFKVRGWLGKTKNLDGKQLEKDIDLLKNDKADLLVIALSETAYRKWRGEGPAHQAARRTGTTRFINLFPDFVSVPIGPASFAQQAFEGQTWGTARVRAVGCAQCLMPGAEHVITVCWRVT